MLHANGRKIECVIERDEVKMEEIEIRCKNCGKQAQKNESESDRNWEHYDAECQYCGGDLTIDVRGGMDV